ncbi:hypothetical protein K503DRAFT_806989 [Rhizopogon vinicolor AM-OR11-026]|uniref:Uncharacterized protein n=1 Tax=Rhizopogon vinicolor AM-OR11-026 TaxID=1314800 RepID=A0A1B7MDD5_9AGAM|nr:hypothetical protein K503DRAFT_806989 [Rhizopogon vinicolor AM-OR11-026]
MLKEDDTVLNLITIYRTADFTTPYADHLVKVLFGNSQEAATSVAYQQRKIKNTVLQTFDHMGIEEDFRQVERKAQCPPSPTLCYPSIPTIATITQAHNHPEATEEEWATWFRTRESTTEPTSSISTISSLDTDSEPIDPVEQFIPGPPTPSPPPLVIPSPACKVEETLPTKKQEVLASFGLPLTQVYPLGENLLTVETAREVAHVENVNDSVIVISIVLTISADTAGSIPLGTLPITAPLFMEREFLGYAPLTRTSTQN